jgi:hypothetical protein
VCFLRSLGFEARRRNLTVMSIGRFQMYREAPERRNVLFVYTDGSAANGCVHSRLSSVLMNKWNTTLRTLYVSQHITIVLPHSGTLTQSSSIAMILPCRDLHVCLSDSC